MNTNFHLSLLVLVFYCALVNAYINVRLEDKLCTSTAKNSLTLLEHHDSAAIFTQQWNGTATSPPVACQFMVYSSWDAYRIPKGTYITITHLNFRKNPETNECLDYIQFVDGKSPPSKPICEATVVDGPTKSPLIIDHRERAIGVIIHIDNSTKINEPLELRMVMTAHSQCNDKDDFLCDDKVPYSCISRHFVNDNITNCMRPCRDEKSCWQETVDTQHLNVDTKAYLKRKFFEEKLGESSQSILKAYKAYQDRVMAVENFLLEHVRNGKRLSDTQHLNVDTKAYLKRKFFEEKLGESSQSILKAYKAVQDRVMAVENFLLEHVTNGKRLSGPKFRPFL